MSYHEIDSFVHKFKTLCQGGRSASLTLSSKAGNAVINLRVDLGDLSQQGHQPHHPPRLSRNGPAQQRRRERRAAARQAGAEEAEASLSTEEKEVLEMAVTAKDAEKAKDTNESKDAEKAEEANKVEDAVKAQDATVAKVVTEPKDATKVEELNVKVAFSEATQTTVEVEDEVVPDSEYGSTTPSSDDPKTISHPVKEPPPPVRDRTLGGIDYYLMSYEDPPFEEYEDEEYY